MQKENIIISPHEALGAEDALLMFTSGVLDQNFILSFGEAAQDLNPIHCDPVFAKAKGFQRPLVHGVMSLAFMEHALQCRFGSHWSIERIEGRFTNMLFVGQSVTGWAKVTSCEEEGERLRTKVRFWAEGDHGLTVLVGKSELVRKV